jgi:hypothetical protein
MNYAQIQKQNLLFIYFRHFMQQTLFEDNSPQPNKTKGLVISKAGKQKLSPNQEAFNKLTQRIEKLQKDIEKKQAQFDVALKIYGTELYPVQLQMVELRYALIVVLHACYKEKKLSKADQRQLKEILFSHLEMYIQALEGEPDEKIKAIISELEGMKYEEVMQSQKDDMNDQLRTMFAQMGVNVEGLDFEDEKAMAEKAKELAEKLAQEEKRMSEYFFGEKTSKKQAPKKKTAKQIAHEKMMQEVEEAKQKNIGSIYKQLAKLFHPDLEQDPERKLEKELLMRELTVAYESKNLHALLMLELKWIHKEQAHLESLTEEKLAVYLQILKEQAKELENQKSDLIVQPQYAVLAKEFGWGVKQYPIETLKVQVKEALNKAKGMQEEILLYASETALHHVKKMIKQWKREQEEYDFADDFDFPF